MSPNCLEPRLGHCFGLNGALKIGLVCWSAMAAVHLASESSNLFTKTSLITAQQFKSLECKKNIEMKIMKWMLMKFTF